MLAACQEETLMSRETPVIPLSSFATMMTLRR